MVLIPAIVALAWWHEIALTVVVAGAAALGARELIRMHPGGAGWPAWGAAAALAGLLAVRWMVDPPNRMWVDLAIASVAALTLLVGLARMPRSGRFERWSLAIGAALYVGGLAGFAVLLRRLPEDGLTWLLLAFAVTWAYDTGAYAVGRGIGRRPFFTRLSPRKTWEGALGGTAAAIGATAAFVPFLPLEWWQLAPFGIAWAIAAQAGDLTESMLKREASREDSGALIPGHGGMLDRIDSLLFVAPAVFVVARVAG